VVFYILEAIGTTVILRPNGQNLVFVRKLPGDHEKWPLLMANYFPGNVLTKYIKIKISHCANSDGQLFSRELPDKN
jgi:hypothetical protein